MPSAPLSRRVPILVATIGSIVAIAVIALVLASSHGATPATRACPTLAGPALATTGTITAPGVATLPPSHDNDAGHSRILDSTPDADADASQIPVACALR